MIISNRDLVNHDLVNHDLILSEALFTGNDSKEVLADFLASKTGKALYDDTTKLWWTGLSYLAEMYLEEIALKQ